MHAGELREARKKKGWTQQQVARHLGVSQTYLSLLEGGHRRPPASLVRKLFHFYDTLSPLLLPHHGARNWSRLSNQELAEQLSALGYPGFYHLRARPNWNPAELLVASLAKTELETRVAEALFWLPFAYSHMDWNWVVRQAKRQDGQNRLGFLVTLARELASQKQRSDVADRLTGIENELQQSVLAREQTFFHESMTDAERRWLRDRSTPEARRWNLLSDLSPEHLSHVPNA